jgi:succinate dehydrogenase/fumarate reductase cytochrome b subunit
MKNKTYAILGLAFMSLFFVMQFALAIDFNQDISSQDKAAFDEILAPVLKIYNLAKYTATVIAVVVLLFAGITYILSEGDPAKREKAKSMAMYVVIGLVVIWAAPLIVDFIVG